MKKTVLLIIGMLLALPGMAMAEMEVIRIAVATDIAEREPVGVNNIFKSSLDKLYCFTEITTDRAPTGVVHVWLHEGKKMAEVPLKAGAGHWRTYSSKELIPPWTGGWRVEVYSDEGILLESIEFIILE
jgi:hypothetical protein